MSCIVLHCLKHCFTCLNWELNIPLNKPYLCIDPFNNDSISVCVCVCCVCVWKSTEICGFILISELSQTTSIEPKLTTYWHKRGEQLWNE